MTTPPVFETRSDIARYLRNRCQISLDEAHLILRHIEQNSVTLRDAFAMAMISAFSGRDVDIAAELSYKFADAMMRERSKEVLDA